MASTRPSLRYGPVVGLEVLLSPHGDTAGFGVEFRDFDGVWLDSWRVARNYSSHSETIVGVVLSPHPYF